jgi:hypothetical protein
VRRMTERRKGPTWFWMLVGWVFTGDRRSGMDRRETDIECLQYGCKGPCNQGDRTCKGKPIKRE